MAVIAASDLLYKLAVTTGAAGDSTAQANPNNSLGKYISTTQVTAATLDNLFDDVSAAENAALTVDYRLVFIHNNHASVAWTTPVVWISVPAAGGPTYAISVDTTGITAKGSSSAQAKTIANELTAPASQSFSAPTTKGTGLSLGASIAAGSVIGIWVQRTCTASQAFASVGATLRCEGNT